MEYMMPKYVAKIIMKNSSPHCTVL